jgi:hypothetical protein
MHQGRLRTKFNERSVCVLDIETISSEQMEDGRFPPWPTHTCVVASMLTADLDHHGEWAFAVESVRFGEESRGLERIEELLQGRSAVSFNGCGFDFPVLLLHAQRARKFRLHALTAAATEPRFWSARHYDLADKFSQFGAARGASLERLCSALGIPAKLAAQGGEVGELHDRGEIRLIEQYCEQDVVSTLLTFAHFRAIETGNPAYHAALTLQFMRWVQQQGEDHLLPYACVKSPEDLLQLSLLGQLDAAFDIAQVNADCRAKQALDASFGEATHY